MAEQSQQTLVSVVIPARNCPEFLHRCLFHLQQSTLSDFEIIVVDDASTDSTSRMAEEMGARLVRMPFQLGPGPARNRGVEEARGRYILFLDSDVLVHPETIELFVQSFDNDSTVSAVFGSYDTKPMAGNVISQYKNLFHHYVHQSAREEASTFWAGCGAIKRSIFKQIGGFDTSYSRPCIEDIELGVRLRNAGFRIIINKQIQVTHLKRWTFWKMIKADFWDRALPWTQLIFREGSLPNDLNLSASQRLSVLLAYALILVFVIGIVEAPMLIILPAFALLFILAIDYWSFQHRIPMALRIFGILAALTTIGVLGIFLQMWAWLSLGFALAIPLINAGLYTFFARRRHPLFAVFIFPLHVFYYAYSGIAFGLGAGSYLWRLTFRGLGLPFRQ